MRYSFQILAGLALSILSILPVAAHARDAARPSAAKHWAFQPVRRPPVPNMKQRGWVRTPVDAFVLAKLEANGLRPSARSDRRTLIRRVTFDLTGLPPSPQEVDAFLLDRNPAAYERLVDRLLASPAYGERWGRYWLDVARYSDTKGYVFFEGPEFPWAFTYRDYVIRAFNEDLPYNQFIEQQLAADRLPMGSDRRSLAALGFITLGGHFMNNMQDIIDDRIDTTCRGLMGLTVSCARCHDHKFDPIPTRDYYSLYGVFASIIEPAVPPLLQPPPNTKGYEAFAKELQVREQKLAEFVNRKYTELREGARSRAAEYMLAVHAVRNQPKTDEFMLIADGGDLNPKMVRRWQAYLDRTRKSSDPVFGLWNALEDLPEKEFADRAASLIAQLSSESAAKTPLNPLVLKAFRERPPVSLADAAQRYGALLSSVDKEWKESPQSRTVARHQAFSDLAREQIRQVLYGPESPPMVPANPLGDLSLLPDRRSQDTLKALLKSVESWRAAGPDAPPRGMAVEDLPEPYEPHVFLRGNPNNLGDAVPRQFPAVASGKNRRQFREGSGRRDLARAITDPSNPLTARVFVNRVWLHHFGAGLVHTPSDFGMRSDPPTNPALLDWLAYRFTHEDGWSVKELQRLILLSSAYQQSSEDRPAGKAIDPENRLLWKMNRQRLDFEALRDSLVAISGSLDRTSGGAPVDLFSAPYSGRRTVYGVINRLELPGLLRTFDFPSPDATCPVRDNTTAPQQALFLMNHPFVDEAAHKLMLRPEIAGEADVMKRIALLYRLIYSREPTAAELTLTKEYLGAAPISPKTWDRYAHALLESNEFVFID